MKITSIRFRRLESHERGYGHNAVEAEATVEAGEDPEAAFEALREWVQSRLRTEKEIDRHIDTLQRLRERVKHHEDSVSLLADQVKRGREIISQHAELAELARERGIAVDAANLLDDGIPF